MDQEQHIKELKQLVEDYDTYLMEIAPFSHKDGSRAKTLRARKELLLSEAKTHETQDAEV